MTKKLYRIDALSQFRMTYFIEAKSLEHALDEFVCKDSGSDKDFFYEVDQEHLGETIFLAEESDYYQFNKFLAEKRPGCSWWMGDKLIRKVDYGDDEPTEDEVGKEVFKAIGTSLITGRPHVSDEEMNNVY